MGTKNSEKVLIGLCLSAPIGPPPKESTKILHRIGTLKYWEHVIYACSAMQWPLTYFIDHP